MASQAEIKLELFASYMAVKRSLVSLDQALKHLPPAVDQRVLDLLLDAQNRIATAQMVIEMAG